MPDEPVGFSLDIDKILRDTGLAGPKRRRPRSTTSSSSVDAAMRRAVRAELGDVEKVLRTLAEEVAKLRRSNDDLVEKVGRLSKR